MLHVASLYGLHPVDLASTAAVPRLHAQLLTGLAAQHEHWRMLAISAQSELLPGVEAIGVTLTARDRLRNRMWQSRYGRRLYFPRPPRMYRGNLSKWRWAEVGATRLASVVPDHRSTVVVCSYAEAVLAARRRLPNARIVHWIQTPVGSAFLDAALAADAAVVPSLAVYHDTWRRSGHQYPAPLWLIPNWVDTEAFRPRSLKERLDARRALGLTDGDVALAFIGRHWIKGSRVVERALAALPSQSGRIVLLSAGDPDVRRLDLAPGCESWSLGRVPPDELVHLYAAADLGVVPSVSEESFGLAALEMMASGLPVVASRIGGLPEFLDDGVTGRLVDIPNGVDSWADVIGELIADVEARLTLGRAARSVVLQRFTRERAQEAWTRVLMQIAR